MERQITRQGHITTEVVYGSTSLSPARASAAQLLTFTREHWHIENKSHWARDVTFDEDRSQLRRAHLPQVMVALRNAAISLLHAAGHTNIAQAVRFLPLNLSKRWPSWASPSENDKTLCARIALLPG